MNAPPGKRAVCTLAYPYEMGEEERTEFLDKLKAVRPGQSYEAIATLLGPPCTVEDISAKEHEGSRGTAAYYYLKKLSDGVNENYDQYISLEFNNDDRLVSIDTNVPGLTFEADSELQ